MKFYIYINILILFIYYNYYNYLLFIFFHIFQDVQILQIPKLFIYIFIYTALFDLTMLPPSINLWSVQKLRFTVGAITIYPSLTTGLSKTWLIVTIKTLLIIGVNGAVAFLKPNAPIDVTVHAPNESFFKPNGLIVIPKLYVRNYVNSKIIPITLCYWNIYTKVEDIS